jgi:hypothetical protein
MTFSPHDSKSLHYVRAEVPLVRLMLRESCDLLSGFVRYEQFDQLKQPIKAAHFIELILESFAENAVDVLPVLELAMSESTPRWFPPRDEIVDVLRTSAPIFWHNLLRDFTVQSIESVIKLVGNPHEINFRGVVTAGLQRIPFEPDFMKLVYNLNFSGVCAANLLPLDHIDEPNYFFKVESPEALEWLLKLLGDEECRIQLRLANDSTHNRTALVQYYHDSQLDLVQVLLDYFGDESSFLFSFHDDDAKFLSFARFCAVADNLELLKRGVEATGLSNISPGARIIFLGFLCQYANSKNTRREMLNYWIESVVSDGPEPDFFAQGLTKKPALFEMTAPMKSTMPMFQVWVKFRSAITRQVREKNRYADEIVNAFYAMIIFFEEELEAEKIDFYIDLFEELVQISSESGQCPTALVLRSILEKDPEFLAMDTLNHRLFDICYRRDFSAQNSKWHSSYAAKLIQESIHNWKDPKRPISAASRLVSIWIDFATEESLRTNINSKNAIDTLCNVFLARHLTDLETLIPSLVQRGGRLTSLPCSDIDVEALEIYKDALRSIEEQS